jgi:hypothetical protein
MAASKITRKYVGYAKRRVKPQPKRKFWTDEQDLEDKTVIRCFQWNTLSSGWRADWPPFATKAQLAIACDSLRLLAIPGVKTATFGD